MLEFVQVTAQYSNAVLVAILPHVSDFAHRLNVPIALPVTSAQVLEFRCDPRKDKTGGLVTLTNGYQFTFLDGRVCVYRSPQSYFSLQDPERIPEFYGPVKLKKADALKIAHETIKKIGYLDSTFHANRKPEIIEPEKIGTNYVSRYRLSWLAPEKTFARRGGNISPVIFDIEVDALNGKVEMLSFASTNTFRPDPKVDVSPPVLRRSGQNSSNDMSGGFKTEVVSTEYAAAFLEAIIPQLSEFASKIKLPILLPLRTNQVELSKYICRSLNNKPIAQIYLTNGDRFNYQNGHVAAFYGHDAYRKFPDYGRLEDFLGKINMTTNQAIRLCEETIKSLGFRGKLPKVWFGGRAFIGEKEFSRYVFYWRPPGSMSEIASIEVDVESKTIKSVFIDDESLWRDPPEVNLPMLMQQIPK